jgi:peptide/nickel transport system ATP-binding protein
MTARAVLELRDLHVTYRTASAEVPAVRGVSLAIAGGEALGLAGESGCGKSTIAGAVLRLLPARTTVTGEILLNGADVLTMTPGRLRAVRWTEAAIVFQGALHSLNPVRRVGHQVEEAISLHTDLAGPARRQRVAELFERVGLARRRALDYPHQLSGGQRQRVLIALALACEPDLLIADEPTTALDVMVQAQVLDLLSQLRHEDQLSVLFITHDLSVLRSTCERLAVMRDGELVEQGPSHDVFDHPQHPYTARLAAAFPIIGDAASRAVPAHAGTAAATERAPVLAVQNAAVRYGDRPPFARAVDGVDLTIAPGEVVALVGESGCGKTSLIRAILGLEPLAQGSVSFGGERLTYSRAATRQLRRRVQMVFQDPAGALNPRQTIYEAVAEGIRIHRLDDEAARVVAALEAAGLRPAVDYVHRYPHEVSGGQRQRALIGAAMALTPHLLLADEPVASLDASIRGEVLELLRTVVDEQGVAVLVVTHDLGLAWNIADRVAVMYLGRIVEEGPAAELLDSPRHPYTRALLSVVPETRRLDQQILEGETPDPRRIPGGCRFRPRCPLVASGEAEQLGILDRCTNDDPVLGGVGSSRVACHAVR